MKHIYFDQNITNRICENKSFSTRFYEKHITEQRQLAMTPFCLIEFCGSSIRKCLESSALEYNIDQFSNLFEEVCKAREYYQNNIKSGILKYLQNCLVENRKPRTKTSNGMLIYRYYENYLSNLQIEDAVASYISIDRTCTLFWECFQKNNTYADIFNVAGQLLALNPYIPCLRLFLKSIKKLSVSENSEVEKEIKKLKYMVEEADIKQDKDLVDTELIQVSVMGYSNKPLHIYTMDNAKQIKIRLHIAHFFLKIIIQRAKDILCETGIKYKNLDEVNVNEIKELKNLKVNNEEKRLRLKTLQRIACHEFRFGKISIIDNSGCIKENIKVKQCLSKTLYLNNRG